MTGLAADELLSFRPLGDPQISPDGSLVAYVQETFDPARDKVTSDIWLVPAAGGTPRRLTASGARDRWPRWSPDGRRLAFVSNRSGPSQLWLIDVTGGEAQAIVTREEPGSAPLWSPDGTRIGFVAAVEEEYPDGLAYPGAPPEPPPAAPGEEQGKDRPRVVTALHHKLDGAGFFGRSCRHVFIVAAEPGQAAARKVTSGRFGHHGFAWSPEGERLVCVANRARPGDDPVWEGQLWVYELATGEARPLLTGEYAAYAPAWSPDGSAVAFVGWRGPFDWFSSNSRLFLADLRGGLPLEWDRVRDLSAGLDRPVGMAAPSDIRHLTGEQLGPLAWSADGDRLHFTVMGDGESHLYEAERGGHVRRLSGETRRVVAGASASRTGRLTYLAGDATHPDEVFLWDPARGEVQLTRVNAPLAEKHPWCEPRRLDVRAPDGWAIEAWLLSPGGGERPPLVLSIHGGPSGMYGYGFNFLFQFLVLNGYAVLYVNPRGSHGYGDRFAGAVVADWGGRDRQDLLAAVDHVVELGLADPGRLGVTGWSYGGFMTCWLVAQSDRFRAAVAGAPVTDQVSMYGQSDVGAGFTDFSLAARPWENPEVLLERSPLRHAGRISAPLLLLHGENDLRCPVGQAEEMFAALQKLGQTCVLVRYPGEPHTLAKPSNRVDRLRRTLAWFDHYLKDDRAGA